MIPLKLIYVCECCDAIVHSLDMETLASGENPPGLTGTDPQNIIDLPGSGSQVTLTTICDECLEEIYGGPENTFYSGPVWN